MQEAQHQLPLPPMARAAGKTPLGAMQTELFSRERSMEDTIKQQFQGSNASRETFFFFISAYKPLSDSGFTVWKKPAQQTS